MYIVRKISEIDFLKITIIHILANLKYVSSIMDRFSYKII